MKAWRPRPQRISRRRRERETLENALALGLAAMVASDNDTPPPDVGGFGVRIRAAVHESDSRLCSIPKQAIRDTGIPAEQFERIDALMRAWTLPQDEVIRRATNYGLQLLEEQQRGSEAAL